MTGFVLLPTDIPTLALCRGLVQVGLACLVWFLSRHDRSAEGPQFWAAGLLLNGIALLTFTVEAPAFSTALNVVNHLGTGLAGCSFLVGFWRFNGLRRSWAALALVGGLPVLSLCLWEFWRPDARMRILFTACSQLVFYFYLQRALAHPPREELASLCRWLRMLVWTYTAVFAWAYTTLIGTLPSTVDFVNPGYHRALFSICSLLFMLALAVGCIGMLFVRLAAQNADLATMDWLTGLFNRRGLVTLAARDDARRSRQNDTSAVICVDVDLFKLVNDRFGHEAGDRVLQALAEILRQHVRASDLLARLGGDEFAVLLAGSDEARGRRVAERVRQACARPVVANGSAAVTFSISAGVAEVPPDASAVETLHVADRALYAAKHGGRDRVVCASELDGPGSPSPGP